MYKVKPSLLTLQKLSPPVSERLRGNSKSKLAKRLFLKTLSQTVILRIWYQMNSTVLRNSPRPFSQKCS